MEIIALSYNIKTGLFHPEGLEAVARVIEALQPDLVALQEVDRGVERSAGVDQAGWLARRLGLHGVFGRSFDWAQIAQDSAVQPGPGVLDIAGPPPDRPTGGEYGNAVLSRWPIERHAVHPLPMPPAWDRSAARWQPERRTVLATTVRVPEGRLHFLSTHFGLQPDERLAQASALLDVVAAWAPRGPLIAAGDFNAQPDSAEIARVRAGLVDAAAVIGLAGDDRVTFPSGPRGARTSNGWAGALDYIFVRGLVPLEARVPFDATCASDHQPLLARLAWP